MTRTGVRKAALALTVAALAAVAAGACLLSVEYNKVDAVGDAGDAGGGAASADCGTPGDEPQALSCTEGTLTGGKADCVSKDGEESCCRSLAVPCGTFQRSFDGVYFTDGDAGAALPNFRLDKYEATVGRFREFVSTDGRGTGESPPSQGAGAHPGNGSSGWKAEWSEKLEKNLVNLRTAFEKCADATWTTTPTKEKRPINCVTWYEAFAFCAWDGGWLPSEAEWNYAAAGGAAQRVYPWSNPPDQAELDANHAIFGQPIGEVGSRPPGEGLWHHLDLAGNVAEWVMDWQDWGKPGAKYETPCDNCVTLANPDYRVVRSGAFGSTDPKELAAGAHSSLAPGTRSASVGFRCARPAK
ncbi:MAG: SUMF1/EgtB/PvdO family nonheme iron enzyme [Deltaproteobacteria bacterium]|nr:SUMF1/EgtB/PvdO family nonheme iron enzyme [Deltaproteobacteria bacterium]